jgi:S-adenosylmethionine/arginine decarboxylase-like enzyme
MSPYLQRTAWLKVILHIFVLCPSIFVAFHLGRRFREVSFERGTLPATVRQTNTCADGEGQHDISVSSWVELSLETTDDGNDRSAPAGQLLFDFAGLDQYLLSSKKDVAELLLSLVEECELDLIAYKCYNKYNKNGTIFVSCIGSLLDGHITLHAWPIFGVLAIDIFVLHKGSSLDALVPTVEDRLSCLLPPDSKNSNWVLKVRGMRGVDSLDNDLYSELEDFSHRMKQVCCCCCCC